MAAPLAIAKGAWAGVTWLFTSPTGRALLLVGSLAIALWLFADARYDAGYAQRDAEQAEVIAKAQKAQREAEAARDALASQIAAQTHEDTETAIAQTREETQAGEERVRTVVRTVTIPAHCPNALPPIVVDELQEAVKRANEVRRG